MKAPTDREFDITISKMLRLGVTLSALVVLLGAGMRLRNLPDALPNYSHFRTSSPSLRFIPAILQSAVHLNADGVMQLGLLFLILTPVSRVLFCVIGFARQRDTLYVSVSSLVLAILIYSLARETL
jgi:uncharacterized membrane protein